jgi:hypothetical protein
MREAEITCLAPKATVIDLSLRLIRGEIIWVEATSAERSKDLWKLRDLGSVAVRWVQRYKVMKQLSHPLDRMEYRPPAPTPEPKAVETKEPSIDIDDLSRRIREDAFNEVNRHMGDLKASLIKDIQEVLRASSEEEKPQTPDPMEGLSTIVGEAVRNALGSLPLATTTSGHTHGTVEDDTPMFIPATILGDSEVDTSITVKSSESKDSGVDDAMEALRAMKKKKAENK